jgi:outer membrane protein OmpA-like peptidoglycan-associated protein
MPIMLKNTRKLSMKSLNRLCITLFIGIAIAGCSSTPSHPDDCEQITIIAFLPPVVVDLDYKDINGSRNQVIVQGGFQHALAIPVPRKVIEQAVMTSPLPFDNAIKQREIIYFEFDQYSIPASELDELNDYLRRIDSPKLIHVEIEGHTDAKGSAAYNRTLSIKRAQAVRDYLVQHGIQASKISIEGFGKSFPLEANNTEANRAKNRRAVITPLTGY